MKHLFAIFGIIILLCLATTSVFIGIGCVLCLIFPSLSLFQAAILLLVPFCITLILIPLLLINHKMEQMIIMADDDYLFLEEENMINKRYNKDKKTLKSKDNQNKIIVMDNMSIIDKNASCPCGSGEKYKNCCGQKGKKN